MIIKTGWVRCKQFIHCLHFMLISHFKLLQPSGQSGQFLFHLCVFGKCINTSPFVGSKASFFPPPLGLVHPIPWKFQQHNSKSPWLHLGACSESPLHTLFPAVASRLETYHHRSDSQASKYRNHDVDMH